MNGLRRDSEIAQRGESAVHDGTPPALVGNERLERRRSVTVQRGDGAGIQLARWAERVRWAS